MLLRSSSTPILGSLLSNNHETNTFKHHLPPPSPATTIHHSHNYNKHACVAFTRQTVSCNSSPVSASVSDHKGIRRAQSEGNLQGLAYASCKGEDDFCNTNQPSNKMLQGDRRGGERVMAMEDGGFSLSNEMASVVLSEEVKVMDTLWNVGFEGEREMVGQEMHLAKGLGIGDRGGGGGGRGGEFNSSGSSGDGGDGQGVEEYYKKMVEKNPGNPLFLSNYAHFLYQSKKDLQKAEEYYSRAILADPGDGEILSQYAKLVWELHQDEDRVATYYERAVQASPENSHVHASYAGFLWETEEDDDECDAPSDFNSITPQIHQAVGASANC